MLHRVRARLAQFSSVEIPPHSYALLRIVLGAIGLVSMAGLTPLGMFWALDGLAPLPVAGIRGWIAQHGLGALAGNGLFVWLLCSFGAMTVGFRSDLAVLASFVGVVAQSHWNSLPLSSAHQTMTVLLFCLVWAETGQVWSIDARRSTDRAPRAQPAWPLVLMQWQIAIIYLGSGLYKFAYPTWRDGTAVHWALNLNGFHRLPWALPIQLAPVEALLTWGTLLFELTFWLLVLFRRTRPLALLGGVGLHAGLFVTMELGPFSLLMIASYISFLDPERIPKLFTTISRWLPRRGFRALSGEVSRDG